MQNKVVYAALRAELRAAPEQLQSLKLFSFGPVLAKFRGVISYIIHYFTLMFQKCTLFTLFLIFVHYTLFLSNMYIILLIIHYFSNFFVKRVVQDPRRGQ